MAAIEFAVVAPLFLAIVFATFESGWLMTQSMLMDRALDKAVRSIRIGGTGAPATQTALKAAICNETIVIANCLSNLVVELTVTNTPSSFPSATVQCINRSAPPPTPGFASGGRSDVMFVRACLSVDPLVPLIAEGLGLQRNASGAFDVVSVGGFMNEPGL